MKNYARIKQLGLRFSALFFCLLAFSGITKPALSQLTRLPSWAENGSRMPFTEMTYIPWGRSWLVSGQVLNVEHKAEETVVTIHIDHVYAGPDALNDQNFDAHFSLDFSHAQFFDKTYLNTFAKGKRVITSVQWRSRIDPKTDEDNGFLNYSRSYGFPLPTIMDKTPQALEVEAHAQRVGAVYRAEANQREEIMKDYARASLPLTTPWAFGAISQWTNGKGSKFFREYAKTPDLSIEKLGAIDGGLYGSRGHKLWDGSEERADLVERIIQIPQSADGGARGWKQLYSIGYSLNTNQGFGRGILTASRFVEFCKTFMANSTVSDATRLVVIAQIGKLNLPKADVFSFWVSLLRPEASGGIARKSALAVACANALLRNAPWSPEQNKQLQELADSLETEARAATNAQAQQLTEAATILEKAAALKQTP